MKKLAIFDFDGTLIDSVCDVVINFNRALEVFDFPTLTRDEYLGCLGGNIDDIVNLVLGDNANPENFDNFKNTYLNFYYSSKKEHTLPFPKAHDLLRDLQERGVILSINSNRFTDSIESFVLKFFDDIDFLSIEGHSFDNPSKPDPCGVQKIIKKAGVSPHEAIYIGDSGTDILTAKNAGIECVVVKWGYGNQNDWENDYVLKAVDSMDELEGFFI